MTRHFVSVFLITAFVIGIDQYTKIAVLENIEHLSVHPILPGVFNLTLTFNYGAAFGLWTTLDPFWRQVALFSTTLAALGAVGFFLFHKSYRAPLPRTALALILGGAIGNIIDRIRLSAVVDFLDFYFGDYHWPAFNVADSCICIGVFLLIIYRPATAESEAAKAANPRQATDPAR